ncbi:MAG: cytochrome P450 [Deltaproteobacteria bacterium]|nr:cytochrome P450 [Deltaproteobacteria bacterium]
MSLPPGPQSAAIFQTIRYVTKPIPLLEECRAKHGDIFTLKLVGSGDWVFLTKPEHLKEMFTGEPEVLHAGEANKSVFGAITGSSTVLTMDDKEHLARRRLLLPPFHGERMQEYVDITRDITLARAGSWGAGQVVTMQAETQRMTCDVILRAVFGLDDSADGKRLGDLLTRLAEIGLGSPILLVPALQIDLGRFSPWGKIVHIIEQTDEALYAEIRRRRTEPIEGKSDIMSLLLQVKDEEGNQLSDKELRDELVTMLLAGHETTATGLAWAFERALALPDVLAKLRAELDTVVGSEPLSRSHLPKLEYLDAFVKETLRFRPIMPIGGSRKLTRDTKLGGYDLPAGTTVTNCLYLLHRRPDVYDDADEFRPERFIGVKTPNPYEWTPFGGGIRRCIGLAFALLEMKVVLAAVLGGWDLELTVPEVAVERRGFFMAPEGGPPIRVVGPRRRTSSTGVG